MLSSISSRHVAIEAHQSPSPRLLDQKSSPVLLLGITGAQDISQIYDNIAYHAYSIWLFIYSDIKTAIVPSLAFALLTASAHSSPFNTLCTLQRIPAVLLWLFITLLPFCIGNQRQPDAIEEDALNKPWRPLAASRLRPEQARTIMFIAYPLSVLMSLCLGGTRQSLALLALGTWYNDFKGADLHWATRNFLSASGLVCFGSGALEVLRPDLSVSAQLARWYLVIGAVVFTLMHTSDMYDQAGDSLRGRRTVPLIIGDGPARWSIACAMTFWSVFCPWMWHASVIGYWMSIGLGSYISFRYLRSRTVGGDKKTFLLWNIWLVVLYSLPLFSGLAIAA